MSEQHVMSGLLIVRGPFEDWRHKPNQPLPSTFQMIDWLRMMAKLIEQEYVANRDIRAEIEEVIVGLNEWDALKHDDVQVREVRRVMYAVQCQPEPGSWETFATRDTLEEARAIARQHLGRRVIRVTTHKRFVTEDIE